MGKLTLSMTMFNNYVELPEVKKVFAAGRVFTLTVRGLL